MPKGKPQPQRINGVDFASLASLERYVEAWLTAGEIATTPQELDAGKPAQHAQDNAKALLDQHPYAGFLLPPGIERVEVVPPPTGKGRNVLRAVRIDGSAFLVTRARLLGDTTGARIYAASLNAAADTFEKTVQQWFETSVATGIPVECEVSSKKLTLDTCRAKHMPLNAFATIIDDWLATLESPPETFARSRTSDHPTFTDEIAKSFREYHAERADLYPIHEDARQPRAARAKRKKTPR